MSVAAEQHGSNAERCCNLWPLYTREKQAALIKLWLIHSDHLSVSHLGEEKTANQSLTERVNHINYTTVCRSRVGLQQRGALSVCNHWNESSQMYKQEHLGMLWCLPRRKKITLRVVVSFECSVNNFSYVGFTASEVWLNLRSLTRACVLSLSLQIQGYCLLCNMEKLSTFINIPTQDSMLQNHTWKPSRTREHACFLSGEASYIRWLGEKLLNVYRQTLRS